MLPHAKKISLKNSNLSVADQNLVEFVYRNLNKRVAEAKAALVKLTTKITLPPEPSADQKQTFLLYPEKTLLLCTNIARR